MQNENDPTVDYVNVDIGDEGWIENDLRNCLRLKRKAKVEIRAEDDRVVEGELRDISLESLYMYIDGLSGDFVLLDEPVEVTIFLEKNGSKLTITVEGNIIRADQAGLAVKFDYHLKWWPVFTLLPGATSGS